VIIVRSRPLPVRVRVGVLEYALSLARDLAHSWPRGPHQYYLCATPPSILLQPVARTNLKSQILNLKGRTMVISVERSSPQLGGAGANVSPHGGVSAQLGDSIPHTHERSKGTSTRTYLLPQ
jgi:hypothetical protein